MLSVKEKEASCTVRLLELEPGLSFFSLLFSSFFSLF